MKYRAKECITPLAIGLLILTLASASLGATIYVKWDSPGPTFDGSSWNNAFHTIVAGMNAAASGDEVWVAQGTYHEYTVLLKDGVEVMGGFSGSGTTRDWTQYVTTVTGSYVFCANSSVGPTAVVEGFTITGGGYYLGGGVLMGGGSPTVRCNKFLNSSAAYMGGAISASGEALIENNLFINCTVTSPAGQGGAIYCNGPNIRILNNTFVGCHAPYGGAIYVYNCSPGIGNNIITGCTSGCAICNDGGVPAVVHTDFYNNSSGNFCGMPDLTDSNGNMGVDPLYVDAANGDYHLTGDSPCIDAGDSANTPPTDYHGNPRPANGDDFDLPVVDMGAYEYRILHVSEYGTGNGYTWDTALGSIQDAIDEANPGEVIRVASGLYDEAITLKNNVKLYGGYSSYGAERDPGVYVSTIANWSGSSSVVAVPAGAGTGTVLDGFTIKDGSGNGGPVSHGGGIDCHGSATITNNVIKENNASFGSGIHTANASPIIKGNRIEDNSGGPAVNIDGTGSPIVDGNYIVRNSSTGIAVWSTSTGVEIVNNVVNGNGTNEGYEAGGIRVLTNARPRIVNNTIIYNKGGGYGGGGVRCDQYSETVLENNIIAFNVAANGAGGIEAYNSYGAKDYNCVYGNDSLQSQYDDYGYGITPGANDISSDPLFVSTEDEDFRLTDTSGCIGAGDDSAEALPDTDKDGKPRNLGGVDIGAYEFHRLFVKTNGSDAYDGSSWAQAKQTIQAAINAAYPGDEVWIARGTYYQNVVMKDRVKIFGGFYGNESSRSQRSLAAYGTIIDGSQTASPVLVPAGTDYSTTVDGFTLTHGGGETGSGVFCRGSATVANNYITCNQATFYADGIALLGEYSVVRDNDVYSNYGSGVEIHGRGRIIGNHIGDHGTGGLAIWTSFETVEVVNNLIRGNGHDIDNYGAGGIHCMSYSYPVIVNNTIAGNHGGIYGAGGIRVDQQSFPVINNNIIYLNYCDGPGGGINTSQAMITEDYNDLYANWCPYPGYEDYYGVPGFTPGANDILVDPQFRNYFNGDVRLYYTSQCIDRGTNDAPSMLPYDRDGLDRIVDGDGNQSEIVDMGCYEYQP